MQKLFYLLLLFTLIACESDPDEQPPVTQPSDPLTYLALGDSYTIGESVAEDQRWPVQLAARLDADGIDLQSPRIIATTGWTTDELMDGIEQADIEGNTYDLVSLLIGVNNQFRGRPLNEYRDDFTELLEDAIDFAGGDKERVFVVSIPDYGYTPFGVNNQSTISAGIDAFNSAAEGIAAALDVDFYNITDISREWEAGDDTLVASDGLHPSGEQYRRWVERFYEDVKSKIE